MEFDNTDNINLDEECSIMIRESNKERLELCERNI